MKNMFMLKRLAVFTLVFFSLFLLINFIPDSVSSSSSSDGCSSDGCSSDDDDRSPMEKYRDSLLNKEPETQPVELPDNFGEDVQPDPKPGATHNKRKRKITTTEERTVTQKPSSDGCGVDTKVSEKKSASVKITRDGDSVEVGLEERREYGSDGSVTQGSKRTVIIEEEF